MKDIKYVDLNPSQYAISLSERTYKDSAVNVISIKLSFPKLTVHQVLEAVQKVLERADIFYAKLHLKEDRFYFTLTDSVAAGCGCLEEMAQEEARRYTVQKDQEPLNFPQELYNASVIPLREGGVLLYARFHHVIIDGYGMCLFAQRVIDVLEGREPDASVFFTDDLIVASDQSGASGAAEVSKQSEGTVTTAKTGVVEAVKQSEGTVTIAISGAAEAAKQSEGTAATAKTGARPRTINILTRLSSEGTAATAKTGAAEAVKQSEGTVTTAISGPAEVSGPSDALQETEAAFWRDYFADVQYEPYIYLDTAKSLKKAVFSYTLESSVQEQISRFAQENGVTVPYVFAAAYGIYLSGACGKQDAVFLMPRLNRGRAQRQTLGCFTLLVPVRISVGQEDSFADVCRKVQQAAKQASAHKAYGYEKILQTLRRENLVFDSLGEYVFNYYRYEMQAQIDHTLDISVAGAMHNHLTWNIFQTDGRLSFGLDLRDGIYDAERGSYFTQSMLQIIEDGMMGRSVREIALIGQEEQQRLAGVKGKDVAVDADETIPSLFAKAVAKYAKRPALYAGDQSYTFAQLDQVSDAIALRLAAKGAGRGDSAAFMLKRDRYLIPTMLGIAKTGAAFIPIDPMYPKDRISYILENSRAKFLISAGDVEAAAEYDYIDVKELAADTAEVFRQPEIAQEQTAYMIYTSGTTGRPKGVMLSHRGIANIVHPDNNPFNRDIVKNGKGIVAIGSICFDISLFEIFVPLFNGLFVELGNEKAMVDAGELAAHILSHGADILHCTPSRLASYLMNTDFAEALEQVKAVLSAGEVLSEGLVNELKNKYSIRIYNGYGPTETTIGATITQAGDNKTIGAPISNMGILLLNKHQKQVPYGAVGEICIYGNGVGIGYKDRPEETAEKFITYGGMRLYRTGDLGQLDPYGRLLYHGRSDRQIKLRGLRIELSEIEEVMGSYPGLLQANCVVRKIDKTEHLAGFFTMEKGCTADIEALREHLKASLTRYMVPDILKELEEMPKTPGGKTDLKALEQIPVEYVRSYRAPRNPVETAVCNAFAAVLGIEQAGIDDNFFELGGSSLSAVELVVNIEKELGCADGMGIDYAGIFQFPTPVLLAEKISGKVREQAGYQIEDLDYTGIDEYLAANSETHAQTKQLGNVLITGATGYLGIHILIDLLRHPDNCGKIFCLTRPSGRLTALRRMKSSLFYYAESDFSDLYGEKWAVVEGDISQEQIFKETFTEHIDTIINSAANVAHFAYGDKLARVNVEGVKNMIAYALSQNAVLCHVSTISVGGVCEASAESRQFTECDLYIGQKIFNQYIYTKYMAEYALLRAAADQGLAVKIMRVGNLQGRSKDGEFQMNLKSNAFTRQLSSYINMNAVPRSLYGASVNFSPVDETAHMIAVLAGTDVRHSVFHVYPPQEVAFSRLFAALEKLGHKIEVLPDEEFEALLQSMKQSEEGYSLVEGLLTERPDGRHKEIPVTAEFTDKILASLGESWLPATEEYLNKYLNALEGMNMF